MHKRALIPVGVIVIGVAAWLAAGRPGGTPDWLARRLNRDTLVATSTMAGSGSIESETTVVSAETGGRIVELEVDEGDVVAKGQVLARLDTALLDAQIEQADAARAAAQARLALVRAGTSSAEIEQAQVAVAQATTARDAARQAVADAKLARDKPQQLDARIVAARNDVAAAEAQVQQAAAARDVASTRRDQVRHKYDTLPDRVGVRATLPNGQQIYKRFDNPGLDIVWTQVELADNQWWGSWEGVAVAEAARDGAKAVLAALLDLRSRPLAGNAQVRAAEARLAQAEADVVLAEAAVADLQAGATGEQVAVAEAQVRQAEAAAGVLQARRAKMTLAAPRAGLVVARTRNAGEMATPGGAILSLADLDQVRLVIFLPETEIGRVAVGQPFGVTVDSFPGRVFTGHVIYISPEAEFTPKNVQTRDARVNQVFAVKLALDNPEHELKPGMPADAAAMAR